MSTARIIWSSIGVTLVAAMLITAVVLGIRMKPSDVPCRSLTYLIEDRDARMYLTENELNQLLKTEKIYPVGRTIDQGLLYRIEKTILHHPMVRTADCYATPRSEVKVRLTQRIPLLMVAIPGDAYFVDTDRRAMPIRASVRDTVMVATGAVGPQMATHQLADFAEWLQNNKYWRSRIRHVHVKTPQMIYLCLKGENQPRVVLGSMHRYEQKLAKLRTFLDNSAEAIKDKHYTEYDVRFKGQVIGRY